MPDLKAKRTLVKSPPELWEELSEVEGLMKHLAAFGEIKITKLEPEHTVAWEGEHGSGTVSIEPSGWGTKVTFHAELPETAEPAPRAAEPEPEPEPEPVAVQPEPEPEPIAVEPSTEEPPRKRGFWGWLFRTRTEAAEPVAHEQRPEPVAHEAEPAQVTVEVEAVAIEDVAAAELVHEDHDRGLDPEHARAILDEALDSLGAAHHRPFSRG